MICEKDNKPYLLSFLCLEWRVADGYTIVQDAEYDHKDIGLEKLS